MLVLYAISLFFRRLRTLFGLGGLRFAVDNSPGAGKNAMFALLEGYPSGQRGQTVNLLALSFVGSNPTPSTTARGGGSRENRGDNELENLNDSGGRGGSARV